MRLHCVFLFQEIIRRKFILRILLKDTMMFIAFLVTIVMILEKHPSYNLPISQVSQRVISPEEFGKK